MGYWVHRPFASCSDHDPVKVLSVACGRDRSLEALDNDNRVQGLEDAHTGTDNVVVSGNRTTVQVASKEGAGLPWDCAASSMNACVS